MDILPCTTLDEGIEQEIERNQIALVVHSYSYEISVHRSPKQRGLWQSYLKFQICIVKNVEKKVFKMDEMRAMLDDLMGKHRDVPLTEREKFVYAAPFFACIHP